MKGQPRVVSQITDRNTENKIFQVIDLTNYEIWLFIGQLITTKWYDCKGMNRYNSFAYSHCIELSL